MLSLADSQVDWLLVRIPDPAGSPKGGRPLRRYQRRWLVERAVFWLQNYRRLCIRREEYRKLFQGFLHFGCNQMLLRQDLG